MVLMGHGWHLRLSIDYFHCQKHFKQWVLQEKFCYGHLNTARMYCHYNCTWNIINWQNRANKGKYTQI